MLPSAGRLGGIIKLEGRTRRHSGAAPTPLGGSLKSVLL
jgi:hypothetical protein